MADVKWIKITTDVFDDEKILLIESLPEADSIIVIWFKLLCLAGKQNNSGVFVMNNQIAYTDRMLAAIFRRKEATVQFALKTFEEFGMIELIDGVITIPNWNKHQTLDVYERKKERDRLYQQKRRARQKELIIGISEKSSEKSLDASADSSSDVAVSDKDIDKDKDIYINTNCASDNAHSVSKVDISEFFESIWLLYPNKKGKGQISDSKKKTLFEIGIEEMTRAIERYKNDLAKEEWRKPQNGSTFFNSGYVDYLDKNYVPTQQPNSKGKGNKFNNFHQRTYEAEALERMLLEQQKPPVTVDDDPELAAEAEELKKMLKEKY